MEYKNSNLCFFYLIAQFRSYTPGGKWTNRHQLSLNGKQDNFTYEDIVTVAENMGIRNCKHIIGQIGETVAHWKDYAKEGGVNERHSQTINDHLLVLAPK